MAAIAKYGNSATTKNLTVVSYHYITGCKMREFCSSTDTNSTNYGIKAIKKKLLIQTTQIVVIFIILIHIRFLPAPQSQFYLLPLDFLLQKKTV